MVSLCSVITSVTFLLLIWNEKYVSSHGLMNFPNPRGSLKKGIFIPIGVTENAVEDYFKHFPAGDRNPAPGSAQRSQEKAAGPRGWVPYEPNRTDFQWRAGVCGDLISGNDHLRGGKYYNNAHIVANYSQGDDIGIGLTIVGHHNGYIEIFICDVSKCGGEISPTCFQKGFCYKLKRSINSECQSGSSKHCGPIDEDYPERWYIPCGRNSLNDYKSDFYGSKWATYSLPPYLTCEHCVLQWYWVTAHICNPPGYVDYFTGPNQPTWGDCPGQAGARGGYSKYIRSCGGRKFPQEYYQCADVQIFPSNNKSPIAGNTILKPSPLSIVVSTPTSSYDSDEDSTPKESFPVNIPLESIYSDEAQTDYVRDREKDRIYNTGNISSEPYSSEGDLNGSKDNVDNTIVQYCVLTNGSIIPPKYIDQYTQMKT